MGYPELDLNLTDEEKALRDVMRKFGAEVVRPAGIELDKMGDPADVIAEGSVLWDVFRKYRELGFHKRGFPKALGGMAEDIGPMGSVLMGEELGYADAGLAISLGVSGSGFGNLAMSPDPEFQELAKAYLEDLDCTMIGCWAITEPDHGSDWILAADKTFMDPKTSPSLKAVLDGDEYILSGQKSAWVSDGTIATHASLHVALDPSKGMQGTGLAFVPLDLPGISRGKPLDKIGQRALNQGEIFFDNVRIPQKYMLVSDPEMASQAGLMTVILTGANTGMSVTFAGLARAAFDEALQYAKERVQGGKPIIEHQNIKLKLMDMFTRVEASRSLARRTALYNAANPPGSPQHAVAAKVLSTESAFKVASEAIQVFGGNGLSREYVIEKIFRDARASMIEDGSNEALSITAAIYL
ncbi:MAG: acyl-CoA/acyl-ACP dehydrogenase [Deltaproteobacteria bacterium]|nr:acyl-CoA/acyl-ACP dehydrogenase [Deltaproteobacteria bacterium]